MGSLLGDRTSRTMSTDRACVETGPTSFLVRWRSRVNGGLSN
ncbi:hypothetical protein [Laspinema palackyanum]